MDKYKRKAKVYIKKETKNWDLSLLGIKIAESTIKIEEAYDHEFIDDKEEQEVIAQRTIVVFKILGIPLFKERRCYDPENVFKADKKGKIKLNFSVLNKNIKYILIAFGILFIPILAFILGIYFSDSNWLNDAIYIKSKQMKNLEIKGLRPYNKALFKKDQAQYEMNNASYERYEYYHKYYEKVAERIKNLDIFPEYTKKALTDYINGYEERKAKMDYIMFPCKDKPLDECGYGTIFGTLYYDSMLEFDRNELMTYRMILTKMYTSFMYRDELEHIFEE